MPDPGVVRRSGGEARLTAAPVAQLAPGGVVEAVEDLWLTAPLCIDFTFVNDVHTFVALMAPTDDELLGSTRLRSTRLR